MLAVWLCWPVAEAFNLLLHPKYHPPAITTVVLKSKHRELVA
jgi:hypothetical protein